MDQIDAINRLVAGASDGQINNLFKKHRPELNKFIASLFIAEQWKQKSEADTVRSHHSNHSNSVGIGDINGDDSDSTANCEESKSHESNDSHHSSLSDDIYDTEAFVRSFLAFDIAPNCSNKQFKNELNLSSNEKNIESGFHYSGNFDVPLFEETPMRYFDNPELKDEFLVKMLQFMLNKSEDSNDDSDKNESVNDDDTDRWMHNTLTIISKRWNNVITDKYHKLYYEPNFYQSYLRPIDLIVGRRIDVRNMDGFWVSNVIVDALSQDNKEMKVKIRNYRPKYGVLPQGLQWAEPETFHTTFSTIHEKAIKISKNRSVSHRPSVVRSIDGLKWNSQRYGIVDVNPGPNIAFIGYRVHKMNTVVPVVFENSNIDSVTGKSNWRCALVPNRPVYNHYLKLNKLCNNSQIPVWIDVTYDFYKLQNSNPKFKSLFSKEAPLNIVSYKQLTDVTGLQYPKRVFIEYWVHIDNTNELDIFGSHTTEEAQNGMINTVNKVYPWCLLDSMILARLWKEHGLTYKFEITQYNGKFVETWIMADDDTVYKSENARVAKVVRLGASNNNNDDNNNENDEKAAVTEQNDKNDNIDDNDNEFEEISILSTVMDAHTPRPVDCDFAEYPKNNRKIANNDKNVSERKIFALKNCDILSKWYDVEDSTFVTPNNHPFQAAYHGTITQRPISTFNLHCVFNSSHWNVSTNYGLLIDIKPYWVQLIGDNEVINGKKQSIYHSIVSVNNFTQRGWKCGAIMSIWEESSNDKRRNKWYILDHLRLLKGQCKVRIDITDELTTYNNNLPISDKLNLLKLESETQCIICDWKNKKFYCDYWVHLDDTIQVTSFARYSNAAQQNKIVSMLANSK